MSKRQNGNTLIIIAIFLVIGLIIGYFSYKSYLTKPSPAPSSSVTPTTQPSTENPVIFEPKENAKVASPLTIKGSVPPGWMFEGISPVKLVDKSGNVIAQTQAKEDVPGSWQSGNPVYFTATLTFITKEKFGYIVLENDNPSGDPENLKTYQIKIYLNCTPRPACLDQNPRCLIPETEDMCPKEI